MKAKKLHKGYLILTIVIIALILVASYVSVRLLHRSPASGNNDIAVGKEDIAGSEEKHGFGDGMIDKMEYCA